MLAWRDYCESLPRHVAHVFSKTAKYTLVDCRVIKSVIKESRTFIEEVSKQMTGCQVMSFQGRAVLAMSS